MSGGDAFLLFLGLIGATLLMLYTPRLFERFPTFKRASDFYVRIYLHPLTPLAFLLLALASPRLYAEPPDWAFIFVAALWLVASLGMRWEESFPGTEEDSKRIRPHRRW